MKAVKPVPKTNKPVYLDFNATTPLDPRVFEVMKEWYLGPPANAGSRTHVYGQRAKDAVEKARAQVAAVINAQPEEIIFTSGATESNNLAILGLAAHGEATGRKHIISTAIEHKAVLEPLEYLATKGFEVELVPVCKGGFVCTDDVIARCRADTLLVSVMHANNETGVLQPVKEIGDAIRATNAYFHVDASQTYGKQLNLEKVDFDLLSVSSHKIYGPQGIGALVTKRQGNMRVPLIPICHGGGQERGLRPGTIPVPLVVGFAEASRLSRADHQLRTDSNRKMKLTLFDELALTDYRINGESAQIQEHILNVQFVGVDSEALLMLLRDGIAVSNGSACTSESYLPSHVLIAMGLTEDEANQSIRFSWGYTAAELPFGTISESIRKLQTV